MKTADHSRQIALVGSSEPEQELMKLALEIGGFVAQLGAVLICGGLGGSMEAAARGAKEQGGLTIGILPHYDKETANPFIDVVIPTGLGHRSEERRVGKECRL